MPTNDKTEEFSRNPKLFLQTYLFRSIDLPLGTNGVSAEPMRFAIQSNDGRRWSPVRSNGRDAIAAYCLPYARSVVTKLQLGAAADFFFTTELDGCTFVIVNGPGSLNPLVVHFAGDLGLDVSHNTEAPAKDRLNSPPAETLRPKATLSAALSPAVREFAANPGAVDRLAKNPPPDANLRHVRGVFGPPQYYDDMKRRDPELQNLSRVNVIGWRKPNKGWRFYAQASEDAGNTVREIRVTTKEMRLADRSRGNPAFVERLWKGPAPPPKSCWP